MSNDTRLWMRPPVPRPVLWLASAALIVGLLATCGGCARTNPDPWQDVPWDEPPPGAVLEVTL